MRAWVVFISGCPETWKWRSQIFVVDARLSVAKILYCEEKLDVLRRLATLLTVHWIQKIYKSPETKFFCHAYWPQLQPPYVQYSSHKTEVIRQKWWLNVDWIIFLPISSEKQCCFVVWHSHWLPGFNIGMIFGAVDSRKYEWLIMHYLL